MPFVTRAARQNLPSDGAHHTLPSFLTPSPYEQKPHCIPTLAPASPVTLCHIHLVLHLK